jgi:hypothetical protein
MDIKIPDEDPLAVFLRGVPPSFVVTVIIFSGHSNDVDSEFVASWVGRVIGAKMASPITTIFAEPSATAMKRVGLRRNYQYACPYVLFGPTACRADKAAVSITDVAITIDQAVITMTPGWNGASDVAEFTNGGLFEYVDTDGNNHIRSIRSIAGDVLTLNAPVTNLTLATVVTISKGCNRQMSDCEDVHINSVGGGSNINNFGGQPNIPTVNPIGLRNNYY